VSLAHIVASAAAQKPPYNYPAVYDAYPPEDPALFAAIPVFVSNQVSFEFAPKKPFVPTIAVFIVCSAPLEKLDSPKTLTYKSFPLTAANSTGTFLVAAVFVVVLLSTLGKAIHVNSKEALFEVLTVDILFPSVTVGTVDSVKAPTKVSYL